MRIAQIAPLTEAIPPKLYGGTERVVSWLTEELVALGHDVTLFASGDSITAANLVSIWPSALRFDRSICDPNALHMAMLERVRQRASEFDFLHFHLDYYPFSLFARQSTPFVDPAREARPQGASNPLPNLRVGADNFSIERPEAPGPRCGMGPDDLSRRPGKPSKPDRRDS